MDLEKLKAHFKALAKPQRAFLIACVIFLLFTIVASARAEVVVEVVDDTETTIFTGADMICEPGANYDGNWLKLGEAHGLTLVATPNLLHEGVAWPGAVFVDDPIEPTYVTSYIYKPDTGEACLAAVTTRIEGDEL